MKVGSHKNREETEYLASGSCLLLDLQEDKWIKKYVL